MEDEFVDMKRLLAIVPTYPPPTTPASTYPPPPPPPPPPPTPLQNVNPVMLNDTYELYALREGVSYEKAVKGCRDAESSLVVFDTDTQRVDVLDAFALSFFAANPDYSSFSFWTGYTTDSNNTLLAADGSTVDKQFVEDHLKPGTNLTSDQCIYGTRSQAANSLTFVPANCSSAHPYMCKESPCTQCGFCVRSVYEDFTSLVNNGTYANSNAILSAFVTVCSHLGYPQATCDTAAGIIGGSINNDVAKRPAALCGLFGQCSAAYNCKIISQSSGSNIPVDMNFCTSDGTKNTTDNLFIGNPTYYDDLSGTECITDNQCLNTESCDFSGATTNAYQCDPNTGLDSSVAKGECKPLCQQPAIQQQLQQLEFSIFADTCSISNNTDNCANGYKCNDDASVIDSCIRNIHCNDTSGEAVVTFEPCLGVCIPTASRMSGAVFTTTGGAIQVNLTVPAAPVDTLCSNIFTTSTIGSFAGCVVTKEDPTQLLITMSGDASILPGDTLELRDSTGTSPLKNLYTSASFNGSVAVESCTTLTAGCAPPVAALSGPSFFKGPCQTGGSIPDVVIQSSSIDLSGRSNLTLAWSTINDGGVCMSATAGLIDATLSAGDAATLTLNSTVLQGLNESVQYCIHLTATNFLGESSAVNHTIEKQAPASETPQVSITAPYSATLLASGTVATLSVDVDTSTICEGNVAEYKWNCTSSNCPTFSGPSTTFATANAVWDLMGYELVGRVAPGTSLTFSLTSRLQGGTAEASLETSILFNGAPLVAAFTASSPGGDINRPANGESKTLLFDASPSSDPSDPSNILQPLTLLFSCQQPSGAGCFKQTSGSAFYTPTVIDGNKWSVDASKFVTTADNFEIRVNVSKGSRSNHATRSITLFNATVTVVNVGVAQDDCGECNGISTSTSPLTFASSIDNVADFNLDSATVSYSWTVNGNKVDASHLLGPEGVSPNASQIVLKPFDPRNSSASIVPRQGSVIVACSITVDQSTGPQASGSGEASLTLQGPPICNKKNTDDCIKLATSTNAYPDTSIDVQATAFSGSSALSYEYGFVTSGVLQAQKISISSRETLEAQNSIGSYTVYVVAIDSNGGRSLPAEATFVLHAAKDMCSAADTAALALNKTITGVVNSGSSSAIRGLVSQANANNNAYTSQGNCTTGRRSLLGAPGTSPTGATLANTLKQLLATLNGNRAADALGALLSIQDSFPNGGATTDKEQAVLLSEIVVQALDILNSAQVTDVGTVTIRQALRNAGIAADVLLEGCAGDCFGNGVGNWMIADQVSKSLKYAREIMRRIAVSGVTTTAISTPIALAVSRNSLTQTSTANVVFSISVENRSETVQAGAKFSTAGTPDSQSIFRSWCTSNAVCNSLNTITLDLSSVTNPMVYTNSTLNFPMILGDYQYAQAEAPAAVSGIFEVEMGAATSFKTDGDYICSSIDMCYMDLTIPISPVAADTSLAGTKALACVRLIPDTDSYTTEVVTDAISPLDNNNAMKTTVTCSVPRLGPYMIMSYTMPPNPPSTPAPTPPIHPPLPPPQPPSQPGQPIAPPTETPPLAPSPPPLFANIPPEASNQCTGNPDKEIVANVTFEGDVTRHDLNTTDIQQRINVNMAKQLGFKNGLPCGVSFSFGGSRRSLLAASGSLTVDLGDSIIATSVRIARQTVKEYQDSFLSTYLEGSEGTFTTINGTAVNVTATVGDPNSFQGCSSSRQLTASIVLNNTASGGDDISTILKRATVNVAEQESSVADQLQSTLQDLKSITKFISLDCPLTFDFSNATTSRRALLADSGTLAIQILQGTSDKNVQAAYGVLTSKQSIFGNVTVAGETFSVTSYFETLPSQFGSANALNVHGSTIAITVMAMVLLMGMLA